MTSEVSFGVSSSISEPGEWLSVREASIREGVSEKTIYNRIASGRYQTRTLNERTEVFLKLVTSDVPKGSEAVSKPSEPDFEIQAARLEERLNGLQNLLEEKDRTIEALRQTIEGLQKAVKANETATEVLNNERQAMTYQLQKYRGQEEAAEKKRRGVFWNLFKSE